MIKALSESVSTYGMTAAFTTAQVEALIRHCMTPSDWMSLVRACLTPGQYLDWKAFLIEFANEQAAINRATENTAWDVDILLGQGWFVQQQTGYPLQFFKQINFIATRAWKSLPNKGEVSGNLTKIIQGPMDILLTSNELKLLHLAYGDLVKTLERKGLYIVPKKVQQGSIINNLGAKINRDCVVPQK
ncbi:igE-binding protein-like [Cricetulus griseus]|uniref:igE-binding protein-like n=1 Tax=Cricetulus griseus TaxID=10029 RepID=UPI0015C3202A|nr:igE-binding protein-like [Cricetulus griseus]